MKIGEMLVEILGDNSGLKRSLEQSSQQTSQFSKDIKKGVGSVNDLVTSTAKNFGYLAIALKGLDLVIRGVEFNSMMETAKVSFGVMLGSIDKATEKLSELKYLADHSPLTFSGVTGATKTLLQFGVAADDVVDIVKMLGDVSGGNEEGLNRLAYAFGQINANGRLLGTEVRQLIEAGFNPLKTISETTGESMDDLRKRMEAGAVSAKEVALAFKTVTSEGGLFYGMMDKNSKTLEGTTTTTMDAMSTFLGKATAWINDLAKVINEAWTGIFNFLSYVIEANTNVIGGLLDSIAVFYGFKASSKQIAEYWGDIAKQFRVTGTEQAKFALTAETISVKYPELFKKNNNDILKTVMDIKSTYGLTGEEVSAILNKTKSVDAVSKKMLTSDIDRVMAIKLQNDAASDANDMAVKALRIAEKKAKENNKEKENLSDIAIINMMIADSIMTEEEGLKAKIAVRDKEIAQAYKDFQAGKMTKAQLDEYVRVRVRNNEDNQRAIEKLLKATEDYEAMLAEVNFEHEQANKQIKTAEENQKRLNDGTEDFDGMIEEINFAMAGANQEIQAYEEGIENAKLAAEMLDAVWQKHGLTVANVFDGIQSGIDFLSAAIGNMYNSMIDSSTLAYNDERERIENNGLTKKEALEKELSDAIAAGDAKATDEAQKELDLFNLKSDFERKKAKLQYESEKASWQWRVLAAGAAIAESALNAFKSTAAIPIVGPVAAPGAAAAAAAWAALAQAPILAAMPQPPAFAEGGIVPGNSFSGDQVNARLNSGEMVINAQDQKSLMDMIKGVGSGNGTTIQIMLDSRMIAESTVKLVDNGVVKMRSLAR